MAAATDPIAAIFPPGVDRIRREEREETIRIVEYSGFPRIAPQQQLRVGFTRDLSDSGMCLGVDRCEAVGSLLRLCIRDIDGRPADARVGRVVWTSAELDRRFWLGLQILSKTSNVAADRARDEESSVVLCRSRG